MKQTGKRTHDWFVSRKLDTHEIMTIPSQGRSFFCHGFGRFMAKSGGAHGSIQTGQLIESRSDKSLSLNIGKCNNRANE